MSSPRAKALLIIAAALFSAAYKTKKLNLSSLKNVTKISFQDVLRLFSVFYQALKRHAENARRSVHDSLQKKRIRWPSPRRPVTQPATEEQVEAEVEEESGEDGVEESLRDMPIKEEPDFDGVVKGLEVLGKPSEPTAFRSEDVYEDANNHFESVESCVPDEDPDTVQGVFYRKALTLDTILENENEASDNFDCGKEIFVSV